MRIEQAQANAGSKELLVAAVMDLAFATAVLLSMGSAPAPTTNASTLHRGREACGRRAGPRHVG